MAIVHSYVSLPEATQIHPFFGRKMCVAVGLEYLGQMGFAAQLGHNHGETLKNCMTGWWFGTWMDHFAFHIWDVIRNPLTNSIILQDGYCTTNQMTMICNHYNYAITHPQWVTLNGQIQPQMVGLFNVDLPHCCVFSTYPKSPCSCSQTCQIDSVPAWLKCWFQSTSIMDLGYVTHSIPCPWSQIPSNETLV